MPRSLLARHSRAGGRRRPASLAALVAATLAVTALSQAGASAKAMSPAAGSSPRVIKPLDATNCAAATTGQTKLAETGFTASTNAPSNAGDAPQNAITNAVNNTTASRFSSDEPQVAGLYYRVDLGSAQTFDEVDLASPSSPNDFAPAYNVQISSDGSAWTTVASCTGTGTPEIASFPSQTARYVQIVLTTPNQAWWWSINQFQLYNAATTSSQSLGPNTYVFTPTEPQSTIQSTINTLFKQQNNNQFGAQRYALLFMPGKYGTADNPLTVDVGYYEEVAGLGKSPNDVVINGVVNSYNQCLNGPNTCYATNNFWRSIYNLTVNVDSVGTNQQTPGCDPSAADPCGFDNGSDFWATSQEAPIRRVNMNGSLFLMDNTSTPAWCSGGWMSESLVGHVLNGCQQQYMTATSRVGFWTNSVWNQVFCGTTGAPADNFTANANVSDAHSHYTNLATCGTTREMPYLYQSPTGLSIFAPSVVTDQVGPSWQNGDTPGTSISNLFIATPSNSAADINAALSAGQSIVFTPGVYNLDQTLNVTKADTKIIGLGFPSIYPTNNQTTLNVANVPGVDVSGLIFDAGTNQNTIVNFGTPNSTSDFSADPSSLHDVTVRVGGEWAGQAENGLVINQNNAQISDVWIWRADHGAGQGGDVAGATVGCWTCDQLQQGLIVNGNNVNAYGLAAEHTNKEAVIWNGQGGRVVFFQNENPYEVTDQYQWMYSPTQKGYPAFRVANNVTTFHGYGMGAYNYFDKNANIHSSMAFMAPKTPGVQFTHLLTRFLNGDGGIDSVINGVGPADSQGTPGPQDVVSYP